MTIPSRTYKHSTASAALFFKTTDLYNVVYHALRVEVPEIGKEFTDNAYIGTGALSFSYIQWRYLFHGVFLRRDEDPQGLFYYDAASDITGDVKAKVYKVTVDGKNYAQIKFYTVKESETYAEVCCSPFLSVSSLTMHFYCVSSSPKIPYALFFPSPLGLTKNF